ncbi:MAG: (2Fe-2S) ferredoxin domain-containing protein [Betaproteobacteria bacterium]|nr:(2Fe-2S) ferredoxin domain-containing protein [Betaproteobacteria bacterium]
MKSVLRAWPDGYCGRPTLTVCVNVRKEEFVQSCGRRGSLAIRDALEQAIAARSLDIDLQTIACLGLCAKGPNARLAPANSWFHKIELADVTELAATLEREIASMAAASRTPEPPSGTLAKPPGD